jgi:multidrug resistance efflux pump
LLASSSGLTVWALYSRADSPSASAAASGAPIHSDLHYNFLGYADLEQGVTPLYPLQPGRVLKVFAHDGDHVDTGAPLFALEHKTAMDVIAKAEADLHSAEAQRDQAAQLSPQHEAQIKSQEQVVAARQHEAAAARTKANQAKELHNSATMIGSEADVSAAEDMAQAAEAIAKAEQAKLDLLKLQDPSFGARQAEALLSEKQAQLRNAERGLRECTVWAPTNGVVERILISEGEALGPTPQSPAVMFAADGPRIIRAEVEQEWADHVALGMTAAVQDFSATGPTWHGRITRLSDWYTHRRSIMLEPLQFNDVRTLECILTLDPGQPPLRIGQRVRVTLEGGS